MSLARYVQILGRGPGRARSLTFDEAQAAMALMLSGNAAPEATGAVLMLLRMKGETADEIAGLASAAAADLTAMHGVSLDWPSYAAGRTRGLPWFLLAARLVAAAGHPVLLHGWNDAGTDAMRTALTHADIPLCETIPEARRALANGIAYLPLETLSPPLFALLSLRDVFGLRSCINTVARMLNPGRARASVQGVFHPSYRLLQADAAQLLQWDALSVIKGGGGEFECHPAKEIAAFGLRAGAPWQGVAAALQHETRRLDDGETNPALLSALWAGTLDDPFAEAIVLGTAALALETLGHENAMALVRELWSHRHRLIAA